MLTIHNKVIQNLVVGDESSIRLALLLVNDRISLIMWSWLHNNKLINENEDPFFKDDSTISIGRVLLKSVF